MCEVKLCPVTSKKGKGQEKIWKKFDYKILRLNLILYFKIVVEINAVATMSILLN